MWDDDEDFDCMMFGGMMNFHKKKQRSKYSLFITKKSEFFWFLVFGIRCKH